MDAAHRRADAQFFQLVHRDRGHSRGAIYPAYKAVQEDPIDALP